MTGAGLPDLVAKAFEAVGDADSLTELLAGTADFFGAQQGAILISSPHDPADCQPITFGIAPEHLYEWCATRTDADSVFGKLIRLRTGDALLENNDDADHPKMHLLGGVVSSDEHKRCAIVLWRNADRPPFSEPEVETLRRLIGYFQRAIDFNARFASTYTDHQNAVSVLDQAPRAVIILDQNGLPTYQNLEAARVLSKNDGLTTSETGIMIDDEDSRTKILAFLEQMNAAESGQFSANRLITVIPRKSGGAPYKLIMYALPIQHSQPMLNSNQPLAVLLIYDPETLVDLNTSLLHNFYNLTRAEAALAQSMFLGNSLPEATHQLGVSINTTRTQLRSIFKKVGVHSQAALLQEFAKSIIQG